MSGEDRGRLRIAFVSQYFFPEQFSNNTIVEDMVARGHEVDVVTGVPNYGRDTFFDGYSNRARREEDWRGAKVHRAWSIPRGRRAAQLLLNYITFPVTGSWTALRRIRGRPDVAFVSMLSPPFQALPAILLRRFRGTPVVYWVQDIWPESATHTLGLQNPLIVRPLTAVCRWIFRRADMVLVQSEAFPPMVERFGVPAGRIRVLPNTAPPMYRPMTAEEAPEQRALMPPGMRDAGMRDAGMPDAGTPGAGGAGPVFRLMFAGNIGESQDFDTLLAAAALLRDHALHWVIIGSGRDLDRVRGRVAELGLEGRVHLLGRHPEETMPGFFAQADALIVSLRDNDIFRLTVPYKVQCYMACGRPVLAVISGEGARVVEESTGGLGVPPGDPERLAQAIRQLMAMPPEARQDMGRRARAFYEANYSRERVYGNLETWLREAAERT